MSLIRRRCRRFVEFAPAPKTYVAHGVSQMPPQGILGIHTEDAEDAEEKPTFTFA
jgi:hypothetical protein